MNNTKQEATRQLAWPRPQVQAEWSLLSRCLEDSAYLPAQSLDDQVKAIEMAIKHGVGPLLYHRLKTAKANGSLTELVGGRLKQEYFQTAAFNLLLSSEIPSLLQGLTKEGIPVLWVKGVILAATIYSDFGLRPSGDLDAIVSLENIDRAEKAIRTLGYIPASPEAFGDFEKEISHARAYQKKGGKGFALELHQALVSDRQGATPTNGGWFWSHTTQVSINGSSVVTLSPEANLIYLCVHLVCHHGWEPRFIWLYDIHRLLEKCQEALDWGVFRTLMEKSNWQPYVGVVLKAAKAFLRSPLPEEVLAKFSGSDQKLGILGWQTRLPPTRAIVTLDEWRRIRGLGNRVRFLYHVFFPTRAYMVYRYQPSDQRLWPLLYPYRWSIMFGDGIETLRSLYRQRRVNQGLS
jgi:hypothetical protein